MLQAQAQFKVPDSLKRKSYAYLSEKMDDDNSGRLADSLYAWSYLYKAKSEKNLAESVMGFKHLMYHSPKKFRLIYADSMVETASETKDALIIGSAYLSRGVIFYGQNRYNNALNDYVMANEYLSKTKDKYQIYKAKYNLGLMKYFLKYTDEAYSLFKECTQYYETNGGKPYLHSLHMVALCYQSMGKFERSTATNTLGIAEALQTGDHDMVCYFEHCQGVNDYLIGNYDNSIRLLEKSMPGILKNDDGANAAVGYFYLGKDYLSKNDLRKALPFLKKIDSISRTGTYLRNDLWESYDILVAYYESIHDEASKSYYSKALTKATRASHSDYESVSGKMARAYSEKIRQSETEKASIAKSRDNAIIAESGVIILLAIGLGSVIYKFKKQKQIDKKKFKAIFYNDEKKEVGLAKAQCEVQPSDDLNPEVRKKILDALDHFEKSQGFLDKEAGLPELSKFCESNNSYVSRAINVHKGKSVPDYLDSLRIGYVHQKLKGDKQYIKITIAAIAEDAGFKTPQKFNKAFRKYTGGLLPSFYIEQIRNDNKKI